MREIRVAHQVCLMCIYNTETKKVGTGVFLKGIDGALPRTAVQP